MAFSMHQASNPATNEDVKIERQDLEQQLAALRLKIEKAADDARAIVDLTAEIEALKTKLADLKKDQEKADAVLLAAQQGAADAEQATTRANTELGIIKKAIETAEQKLKDKEAEVETAGKTLETTLATIKGHETSITNLETKIDSLGKSVVVLQGSKQKLLDGNEDLRVEARKEQDAYDTLKRNHTTLKDQVTAAIKELETATTSIGEYKTLQEAEKAEYERLKAINDASVEAAKAKAAEIIAGAQAEIARRTAELDKREGAVSSRLEMTRNKERRLKEIVTAVETKLHKPLGMNFGDDLPA